MIYWVKFYFRIVGRIAGYCVIWIALSIFFHEVAWIAEKWNHHLNGGNILAHALMSGLYGIIIGVPFGLIVGSAMGAGMAVIYRAIRCSRHFTLAVGLIMCIMLIPSSLLLPKFILSFSNTNARLLAAGLIIPHVLALYWSQIVARKYINGVSRRKQKAA